MIKVVIIDFDDSLSLTEKACFNIENHIAQLMGFPPMKREAHLKNWGQPVHKAITERIPGIDANQFMTQLEKILPEFVQRGTVDVVTDLNMQSLDILKLLGLKIAILTSRTLGEVKHLLHTNHPLSTRIDAFYHRNNVAYVKPDPRVFAKPLEYFHIKAREAVYIGDSTTDAIAAKKACLHFIALLESGLRTEEDFKGLKVDFFANKFSEIIDYIQNH